MTRSRAKRKVKTRKSRFSLRVLRDAYGSLRVNSVNRRAGPKKECQNENFQRSATSQLQIFYTLQVFNRFRNIGVCSCSKSNFHLSCRDETRNKIQLWTPVNGRRRDSIATNADPRRLLSARFELRSLEQKHDNDKRRLIWLKKYRFRNGTVRAPRQTQRVASHRKPEQPVNESEMNSSLVCDSRVMVIAIIIIIHNNTLLRRYSPLYVQCAPRVHIYIYIICIILG